MKLTKDQENTLRKLAFAGTTNADIATRMRLPLSEVYAQRSRLGITRDKVAAAKSIAEPAPRQLIESPAFEAAAAEMDKVAIPKPPKYRNCRNCAHWACRAAGTDCTMTDCSSHISKDARRKSYLFDRKKEFICSIARQDIGALPDIQVQEIKAFLDKYILDGWRQKND